MVKSRDSVKLVDLGHEIRSYTTLKSTYLGTQTDLIEQQNIGIDVNMSLSMIVIIPATSEQFLMMIFAMIFFLYKKNHGVILDRIRPLMTNDLLTHERTH